MFDDDAHDSSQRPAARLIDELESIKGALADDSSEAEVSAHIPLLDDMVIGHLDDNARLLNLGQIFDEGEVAEDAADTELPLHFPRFTLDVAVDDDDIAPEEPTPSAAGSPPKPRPRPDYSREVLIQELVDEFIPQIEAELHRRLQKLDAATLHRLKDAD